MGAARVGLAFGCAAALAAASCASRGPAPARGGLLPPSLARLLLNDDHPTMPPVPFDHALHAGQASCADCHHTLREDPGTVPAPCTSCHVPAWLEPEHDESEAHDHSGPPDL